MVFLLNVVASEEVVNPLPFPAPVFGAIALVLFLVLAAVMWSYRDVAHRHSHKSAAFAQQQEEHSSDAHSSAPR